MNPKDQPVRLLIVEDNPDDADLLRLALRRGGGRYSCTVAGDYDSIKTALMEASWDCVLSDYNVPGTRFSDILDLAKASDPDLPVIVVSGSVGEEVAVSLMRAGAADLILKSNLSRLDAAIARELKAAEESHARRESEDRFRDIVLAAADWVWETDAAHRLSFEMAGRELAEWSDPLRSLGRTHWEALGASLDTEAEWKEHRRVLDAHLPFRDFRFGFRSPSGQDYHVALSGRPAFDRAGNFAGYRGTATDETVIVGYYRRAEDAEATLRAVLEAMPGPVLLFDRNDELLAANDACRRVLPAVLLRRGTTGAAILPVLKAS
ncbi:MAG TPA: response regulator, partial [Alphaproteobacteria bacterium]|nr:response regulator [Alphaproteobacteria bacterium]